MFTSASAAIGVLVTSPPLPMLLLRNISRRFSNSICSLFSLSSSIASANTPPSCMCCSRSNRNCEFISIETFLCCCPFACGLFGRNIGCAVLFPLKSYPANPSFSANDPARSPSLDAAAECSPSPVKFVPSNSSTTIAVRLFFAPPSGSAALPKLSAGAFITNTNGLGFTCRPVPFRFRNRSIREDDIDECWVRF